MPEIIDVLDERTEEMDKPAEERENPISCKNCVHKDVCFFLTQLNQFEEMCKCTKITELPFSSYILALKCVKFESVSDK